MKKLLIFDLDGTLLYTLSDLTNAVNYALDHFHYPLKSEEEIRKAIGNGVAVLMSRCLENGFDNPNYDEALKLFRKHYSEHYMDNTHPYDGMLGALIMLKKHGYRLAVVTNKINEIANRLINHFFPNIFDIIQGDTKELKKKPSNEMVYHVLDELKISIKDSCYIGDTNVDYETAVNSKMDVLLVTYGFRTKEEMDKYQIKADRVANTKELVKYFIK